MKLLAVLLSLSLTTKAFSECKPVTPLNKGDVAPCTGYLFTPEKELELRIKNEEYKILLEQSKLYLQQKELYQSQIADLEKIATKEREKSELWRNAAETTTEKYVKLEESRTTRDWVFLVSGVGLTVLSGWAIGQAAK